MAAKSLKKKRDLRNAVVSLYSINFKSQKIYFSKVKKYTFPVSKICPCFPPPLYPMRIQFCIPKKHYSPT